jgi:hypothetical protein
MSPAPENEIDDPALTRDANGYAAAESPAADAVAAQNEALDVGSLIRAALLNGSDHLTLASHDLSASADIYDGHVPFTLDADILPAIDTTLDLLTTSTDLFDVPTFDFGHTAGDVGDA